MVHGGSNPAGNLTTLEESIATGYPNDLPLVSYDFQAPIGEYGQERETFRKIKSLHLFLNSFGSDLASMSSYAPDRRPESASDTATARIMLRANGNRGFLFVNNYVRKLEMPVRRAFQVQVGFPSGTLNLPSTPIDVPANSDFIWPLNLDLDGAGELEYSTAQLLFHLDSEGESTYFFFAVPGLRSEFSFDPRSVASVRATSGLVIKTKNSILVRDIKPGKEAVLEVAGENGRRVRVLLLTEGETEQLWRVSLAGLDCVLLSPADVFSGDDGVHLRSISPSSLKASLFVPASEITSPHGLWREKSFNVVAKKIDFALSPEREAGPRPALRMAANIEGRDRPMPRAPEEADFASAALWSLTVPAQPMTGLSDIYLRIRYAGDVARLSLNGRLLDDDFYKGNPWEIGLKRFLPEAFDQKLELGILPLPKTAPIYLDARAWESMKGDRQSAKVEKIELLPEYEQVLTSFGP
jgi:hypothetical protein